MTRQHMGEQSWVSSWPDGDVLNNFQFEVSVNFLISNLP